MTKAVWLACAAFCGATLARAATEPTPPSILTARSGATPMVGGAYLGMTLAAWKALPRPPSLSPRAAPTCDDGPAKPGTASGRQPVVERHPVLTCSYLARYGAISLTQSFPLSQKYLARDPHYAFTDGRLSAIRFRTSLEAYDTLMALFTHAYGAPKETTRDYATFGGSIRAPRVQQVWRLGDQSLRVIDPAARPDRLEVELTKRKPPGASIS